MSDRERAPAGGAFTPTPERYYSPVTAALMAGAEIEPAMSTLDLHSATGYPALTIAGHVGPSGSVLATHPVSERVATARAAAEELGVTNVRFECVASESLPMPTASFDAVTMRHGMVFMTEPQLALGQAHRLLRAGRRIALSEWGALAASPFVHVALDVLARHLDASPPEPPRGFMFAEEGRLQHMLETAGFVRAHVEPLDFVFAEFESGQAYWEYVREFSVPLSRAYARLTAEQRTRADQEIPANAEQSRIGDKVVFRSVALIATAQKA
jgi:ubiquinone/menaquinone biosynthesis C-methylase UbiE